MLILVDADAVAFRAAAAVEKEQWVKTVTIEDGEPVWSWNLYYPKGTRQKDIPINEGDTLVREKTVGKEEDALHLVRGMMSSILAEFAEEDSVKLFFTPLTKTCFRYKIYSEYKANRTRARPVHLEACRNYLKTTYAFEEKEKYEADDLIAEAALLSDNVIVHNDKDLDQIIGFHYNFVKREHYQINPFMAHYNLSMQILTGDTADNIKGIKGIGKQRAELILRDCTTLSELQDAVVTAYEEAGLIKDGHREYLFLQENLCTLGYNHNALDQAVDEAIDECFIIYGDVIKELGKE